VKTFPTCCRTQAASVWHQTQPNGVTDRGMRPDSLTSTATSSGTDSQTASKSLSPNDAISVSDASKSTPDCKTSLSPVNVQPLSGIAVTESGISSIQSTSTHRMNLDDYRRHRTKLVNSQSAGAAASPTDNHRSEDRVRQESAAETFDSSLNLTSANVSGTKPRIMLKISSEVVVDKFFSHETPRSDVRPSNEMQNVVCNGDSLPEPCSSHLPQAGVNGDVPEKLNSYNADSSVKTIGRASCTSSSCEEGSTDLEPPLKRARMSVKQQRSSSDNSACPRIHRD